MGRDKALLPHGGRTLAEHVAGEVLAAVGTVTLVGDRDRYGALGFPVIADRLPGNGPLGGVAAAVESAAEWALVVACDMPNLTREFLEELVKETAECRPGTECIVPRSGAGLEPLCAVYHHRALPLLDSFLNHKFLKMQDVVEALQCRIVDRPDIEPFRNLNTPEDLNARR
jgi:molybdopterin-guanine dinucleotide biosynthesis protein A